MRYVKKIYGNVVEYRYFTIRYDALRLFNVSIVVGDTDVDDYEEIIKVTKEFNQPDIKGVYSVDTIKGFIFVAYIRLSALLDDCIIPVGYDFSSEWRNHVSIYFGCPESWNPRVVNSFTSDVEFDMRRRYSSIAEWLINYADSTVFYLGANIVIFRFRVSDAYRYKITDKGLTYLAKARLLG